MNVYLKYSFFLLSLIMYLHNVVTPECAVKMVNLWSTC